MADDYPGFDKQRDRFMNRIPEAQKTYKYGTCALYAGRFTALLIIVCIAYFLAKCLADIGI